MIVRNYPTEGMAIIGTTKHSKVTSLGAFLGCVAGTLSHTPNIFDLLIYNKTTWLGRQDLNLRCLRNFPIFLQLCSKSNYYRFFIKMLIVYGVREIVGL